VQVTPDLLPADVTGTNMPEPGNQEWKFHPGPVFANIVIADEINRASPKTQSAMLQVMEERTVTVDRTTHLVPRPFVVIATQNPIEMDGTYRLPEAQLDRFLMRIKMDYPSRDATLEIMRGYRSGRELDDLPAVLDTAEVAEMIAAVEQIHVADAVARYIIDLAEASREHAAVQVGASPRGCLALMRAGRAAAAVAGRDYVMPEDVKDLAPAVLGHRLILTPQSDLDGATADEVVKDLLAAVAIPRVQNA
jgi:MoxR-like ATPase